MEIAYLGPRFTYSEQAAQSFAAPRDAHCRSVISLEAVARQVSSGASETGVMAYYNFLEGLVQECLDLIYENDLTIIDACRVPINLAIGRAPIPVDVDAVYSHPKALAQSSEWLLKNLALARQVPVTSTAAGARQVLNAKSGAAIAHVKALEDLEIIATDIGNRKHGKQNSTDFYLVAKEDNEPRSDTDYLTMIAVTPHVDEVGLLQNILYSVAYHNLNNAKIHSRPAIDEVAIEDEPQMFYLEIMSHKDDPDFIRCVDSLRYKMTPKGRDVEVVRVLGSYARPNAV